MYYIVGVEIEMFNSQIININKKYYDKYKCKFAFCESCYWFATILVDKSIILIIVIIVERGIFISEQF